MYADPASEAGELSPGAPITILLSFTATEDPKLSLEAPSEAVIFTSPVPSKL